MQELPLGPDRREKDEPDRNFLEGEGFTSKGKERAYLAPTSETITKTDKTQLLVSPTHTQSSSQAKAENGLMSEKVAYRVLLLGEEETSHLTLERNRKLKTKRHEHSFLLSFTDGVDLFFTSITQ